MNLTTLLLFVTLLLVSSAGSGQITVRSQITLKEKKAPLEKVVSDIEKQTPYVFLYDPGELTIGPISIDVKNATLQETLERCFRGAAIEFTVVGNNVLLKKRRTENAPIIGDTRVRGTVVDSTGQPLAGVTVVNKRDMKGTETDSSGSFSLSATKGDVLRFSFVGYNERQITIGDQGHIHIALELHPASPDEIVLVGYGSSKKRDLTGAVSVVNVQELGQIPYNTFDNALAGKAAGVEVTESDGTPGGMVRVRIRGTSSLLGGNDPLYVIDGIPIQVRSNYIDPGFSVASEAAALVRSGNSAGLGVALPASFVNGLNSLGGLNPDDIASITVLKDASSTAIYGSKASNGVVIITTKTGKANMPPQVVLDDYSTVTSPYRAPRLLNTSQYKTLLTEAAENAFVGDTAAGYRFIPSLITSILDTPTYFGAANTKWLKQVTRTTLSNNIGLSVSGGGQVSKYFTSLSYNSTPGVLDNTNYQRITGNINLEAQVNSKFRLVTNLMLGFTNQDIGDGAYMQAVLARPDLTPRDAAGNYSNFDFEQTQYGFASLNPVALLSATNNGRTLTLLGSLSGIYAIFKGLHFRSTVSLNMQQYNQRNYLPSFIDLSLYGATLTNPRGIGSDANSRFADWFLENTLTYTKQLGKHSLNAVIGQSYETTKYSFFRTTAAGYPNNTTLTGLSSADSVVGVAGDDPSSPQSYLLSFYARANYSYLDKYLFTFTGRADGSSKFGPNNKYGYFPSGAIAWRISREGFMKNLGWINDLKLRGSYGLTGNQNIGDQMYRTLYSPSSYAGSNALVPTQFGNQGIKWESTEEVDAGLDISVLSGRLNATADYYNRQTRGDLLSLPTALSTGYGALLQNAVGLRNRGFEATVSGDIVRIGHFTWTASINVTWNSSLVTRLDPAADVSQIMNLSGIETIGTTNTALIQGKPLGLLTGFYITGIIKTQAQLDAYTRQLGIYANFYPAQQFGDPMYKLFPAGSPFLGPADNEIIGSCAPKYYGGITQEFIYKKLGLQCYFTFSKGGHLLWAEHIATAEFFGTANANLAMLNRYTPTNTNSNDPRLNLNNNQFFPNNLDVFSSSYLKLRSLTLNYHFDQVLWMKRTGISSMQVSASATNIFTITKYPGSNPEASDDPYSAIGGYIDAGNYPATRTFSLGLKAAF